ncbi:DUF6612 family protein [Pseudobacteroides cellulosolvens]|uniref:Copper amine oxidase-like domain-containing protein n=1 Tax=Pseudobacteroides cellulosolvens ATCC 35603 = DSM 2933 TaxID=398512 RepID=A0A0L6JIU1_9FIRM|nr:DUF6612 family protein [Pseudobacteroides cellulosolvens]KNY25655.1 copper amine oxidase-like domain-containing protein [Pseudobacteroides cellulosolvens ATCC 35603 = DSM 2933]
MKKVLFTTILSLILAVSIFSVSSAKTVITENSKVKIVIDGKIGQYKDVPLNIDGRTMLPLVEILNNLGIANDGESIVWNGKERSITISTDTTKINLKIGVKTAYVNDTAFSIDVAPMIYSKNNRTYIPVAFVAKSLGKKVLWDGSLSTVLIRSQNGFDETKTILTKAKDALIKLNRFKVAGNVKIEMGNSSFSINGNINLASEIDQQNRKLHSLTKTNMVGMTVNIENYYDNNIIYSNGGFMSFDSSWEKKSVSKEEYLKELDAGINDNFISISESLCAGLVIKDGYNENELLLEGDIYSNDLFKSFMESNSLGSNEDSDMVSKFNMSIYLDKNTFLVTQIHMKMEAITELGKTKVPASIDITAEYSDYNKDFEINVPEDVKESAVEEEPWY